jgi:hypothetical protein
MVYLKIKIVLKVLQSVVRLVVPGLGLVIAGAGAGAVTAGIVGALIGVKSKSDEDQRRFENDWRVNNENQVNA